MDSRLLDTDARAIEGDHELVEGVDGAGRVRGHVGGWCWWCWW
jgi:hypothetical protein